MKQILVIEPSVYICENNNNETLLYNTYNKKSLYYKNLKINKIAKSLLSEDNNYIIYWDNDKSKSNQDFINDIISNNFGFIDKVNKTFLKPIQLYPISTVQQSLEINHEDYFKIIRKNILKHLKEVTIYFNSKKNKEKNLQLHKQFPYPIINQEEKELTAVNIINFIDRIKYCPLKCINIVGFDLFKQKYIDTLITYLASINVHKRYYLELSDIPEDIANIVSIIPNKNSSIVLTLFYDSSITKLVNCANVFEELQIPIHYRCVVASEKDVLYFQKIILKNHITNYSFIPYFDNNYFFLKKNVFLQFDEILKSQHDVTSIHTNEYINPLFFGKICLMPDNTVKTDIHSIVPIGYNDENFIIQESLFKALTSDNNWNITRSKVETCKNCVARNICTPISNYELMLQNYKLCGK